MMESVLLILFIIGAVFAILSVIVGDMFDFEAIPYVSPTLIAAFATVFGGLGYYLLKTTTWHVSIVLIIAMISAVFISVLLFFLVILPLNEAEKSTAVSQEEMIEQLAIVTVVIRGDEKGEIIYTQGYGRLNAPAIAEDKNDIILRGERVVVVDIMDGTFVVRKIKS